MRKLKKAVIERALGAETSHHPGYAPGHAKPVKVSSHRNGNAGKTVPSDDATLRIDIPCDRRGSVEPKSIGQHERRFTGFGDKIIAMCSRGMTTREIQAFLLEIYATDVSPDFIGSVTDES